jgi:Mn2+/Fe2+ NRAMP family transporter
MLSPSISGTDMLVKLFIASLIAVGFYALVFLIIRGSLVFRGGLKFNLDPEARRSTLYGHFESPEFIGAVAKSMLWYVA